MKRRVVPNWMDGLLCMALHSALFCSCAAAAPVLHLPVKCDPGISCHIQNFVDHDPGPRYRDYRCGRLSYDGHRGTDIRVSDLSAMKAGVPVLAAAAGRVMRVLDGRPDRIVEDLRADAPLPQDGGNAVLLEHEDGWTTLYAHLRKGSIAVRPGEKVIVGQQLGLLGFSGRTEFPHMHFEVRHNENIVDPFAPAKGSECADDSQALWDEITARRLAYRAPVRIGSGFAPAAPSKLSILADACHPEGPLPKDPKVLVYWAQVLGLAAKDEYVIRFRAPSGEVLAERVATVDSSKATWLSYIGIRRPSSGWATGKYLGEFVVNSGGNSVLHVTDETCISSDGMQQACVIELSSCAWR